jgi:outer membrane receptor protein involved in Fe transport
MVMPKLALIFGPWKKTEVYLNYGHGFHSNDARGTTIKVDPSDGVTPVQSVKPLVRTKGYELGVRSEVVSGWQSTLSLWNLDAASELLFVGDAGTTEPSRPSRRYGIEWTNLYLLSDWLAVDANFAWSHARFRDHNPLGGDYIPGAVSSTANVRITVDHLGRWFGALRLRYFGPRPLIEDNSVRSGPLALSNMRVGYKIDARTQLTLDLFNLFNRKGNDIEYWYESQLPGETTATYDRHLHPTEPRTARVTVSYRF